MQLMNFLPDASVAAIRAFLNRFLVAHYAALSPILIPSMNFHRVAAEVLKPEKLRATAASKNVNRRRGSINQSSAPFTITVILLLRTRRLELQDSASSFSRSPKSISQQT
jgi:hypothetical protein